MNPSQTQTSFKIDEGLQKRVQPTLTKLVLYLCQHKPEDPVSAKVAVNLAILQVPYMMQFLEDEQGKGKPAITPEERIELEMLRGEYALLKSNLEKKNMQAE